MININDLSGEEQKFMMKIEDMFLSVKGLNQKQLNKILIFLLAKYCVVK